MTRIPLSQVVELLKSHYDTPKAPKLDGPWQMILWENVAYLADDERRLQAYQTLKKRVGTDPGQILSASDEALMDVCAKILLEEFNGDLRPVLKLSVSKAKMALQKFPGIGEPGAEKILLFTRTYPLLALESNGLRALLRLGFGEQKQSYSTTYRLVQKAAGEGHDKNCSRLILAHLLLRRHGQELCRLREPLCGICPLAEHCAYHTAQV